MRARCCAPSARRGAAGQHAVGDLQLRARRGARGAARGRCAPIVITQGFIASDDDGNTVLLGRGGSDTSAAYLAAKLRRAAARDLDRRAGNVQRQPALHADRAPAARAALRRGAGDRHQRREGAAPALHPAGAPVPHPAARATPPRRRSSRARCSAPKAADGGRAGEGGVHQEGHHADLAGEPRACGTRSASSPMPSRSSSSTACRSTWCRPPRPTSPSRSIRRPTRSTTRRVAELVAELSRLCRVQVIGPCASVSLVGRNIRAILHQLGGAFEFFEEQKIYLVSQAANDLNFTFVVDENQGASPGRAAARAADPPGARGPGAWAPPGSSCSAARADGRRAHAPPGGARSARRCWRCSGPPMRLRLRPRAWCASAARALRGAELRSGACTTR